MSMVEEILQPEVTMASAIFKMLLSLFLGAAIGFERRHKGQIAGMRTFALISMGATLAMLVSIYIPQEYMSLKNGDPGRIAAQVISGIGFLGAGAIIQMKGSVRGLTTAAGIWVTACIGLAVGAGMYTVSLVACVFIIGILLILDICEKKLLRGGTDMKIVRLKLGRIITDATIYRDIFHENGVHVSDVYFRFDYTKDVSTINFLVRSSAHTDFVHLFEALRAQGDVHSLTLTNEVNN